eukprot:CAMPEP_0117670250 /NCGR_PEP_ID=MMETSP0804-20121206/12632_1 /TAXON_ID=1074897 /ORGANISM="Tetraselmis astigmatica, Strain CCMP880" /LENGTH=518 /DNA_ID=CAMNT_0005478495 /DNA_START=155 /DNA_END=1711 /DNA_ORIENTATION=-
MFSGKGKKPDENQKGAGLIALTWNIAAINNNPFEYYITHKDPKYNELMEAVQEFIDNPGAADVTVDAVFTDEMFAELKALMENESWTGADQVASLWETDYRKRKIISGFLKDKDIGSKRLASMPDRITNTISTTSGFAFRPCVINLYEGELSSGEQWWAAWSAFMFKNELEMETKHGVEAHRPCTMLSPISSAKYPAVTPEEEKISIPLQTLCVAIFDAILVHMMNQLAPGRWHSLKLSMCEALGSKKGEKTLGILENIYFDADIMFLQEVAAEWLRLFSASKMAKTFALLAPGQLDSKRNQNSVIVVRKELFALESAEEVTKDVLEQLPKEANVPVAAGDLCAYTVTSKKGNKWLLASFHGDTNGLATIPIVKAVHAVSEKSKDGRVVFGLDANTYSKGQPGKTQDVSEFGEAYCSLGLTSCWGDKPDPESYTTFNTRTYLQAQLNKAVRMADRKTSPLTDRNPKDFILYRPEDFVHEVTIRDNTGSKTYDDEMPFPTLDFPSDHGIVATALRVRMA